MKISIITVNLNNKAGLEKTIQSVVGQTFTDYEYIVIDGGSQDGSKEVIDTYKDAITHWVSEKDDGVYQAMNKGIKASTGEYLLFLNSGDYLSNPNSLNSMLKSSSNEDIIYGDIIYKSNDSEFTHVYPDVLSFDFFIKDTLAHPSTLIKRALFAKYGIYREDYKICADWVFFIDVILKQNVSYKRVALAPTVFLLGGMSSEHGKVKEEKERYLFEAYPFFYDQYLSFTDLKRKLICLRKSRFLRFLFYFLPKKYNATLLVEKF